MDSVILTVSNKLEDQNILFQYQYEECYKCLYKNNTIISNTNETFDLTPNSLINLFVKNKELAVCSNAFRTLSGVSYLYLIERRMMNDSMKINCTMVPNNANMYDYLLPLYVLLIMLCFCGALYYTILMLYRHRIFQKLGSRIFLYKVDLFEDFGRPGVVSSIDSGSDFNSSIATIVKTPMDRRLKGLDCFRGISVLLMIFVNYGGGGYWFFHHSSWNGITVADLVFPWFVFVMGVTLAICLFRSMKNETSKLYWLKTWLAGLKRTIVLFMIGVALESQICKMDINKLRIMGPLQRLAVSYFCLITSICIVSPLQSRFQANHPFFDDMELLNNSTDINSATKEPCLSKCRRHFTDIWFCMPYIVIGFSLLVSHACVSLLVKVPNCPIGYLGPGGFGDEGCCGNCSGGVAGYIDRIVLTPDHMYQTPTCKKLYETEQPYDPEGLLGCLTCTALCFLGFWAGNVILRNNNWSGAVRRLIIYALISTAIGVGLCQGRTNGGLIPINKNLWSVSYVLITAGTSFFLLAFLFAVVDVLKLWNGSPFRYSGMNPIVIYCGHVLLEKIFPVQWKVPETYSYKLSMNVWGVVFWSTISFIMFRKKLFITV